MSDRKVYMERQLELLEHRSVDVRVKAAKRLFYLLQGGLTPTSCILAPIVYMSGLTYSLTCL
jgi:hypothetical protein